MLIGTIVIISIYLVFRFIFWVIDKLDDNN